MREGPYTPKGMDAARGTAESRDSRFDELYAEAKSTLGYGANNLRSVTERYREAYRDTLGRWHRLRDEVEVADRAPLSRGDKAADPAAAAEAGAEDARQRALRAEVERLTADLGRHQQELSKLELSVRSMENAWLFLERGDASLISEVSGSGLATDMQMRIVQAQEAERSRLAQEVHDGPAQALSNAIFQVEYIERVLNEDQRMAASELHFLRESLRRELGEVRTFISQLRPPLLDELGLDGSIMDAVESMAALAGATVQTDLTAPTDGLTPTQQTAVLRIVQEALQNVRKHAASSRTVVATRLESSNWLLEVSDDGRGFEVAAVAARGRRNFGLQFMRERAELVGAQFEVRSRPGGGTVVSLSIPVGEESE
jgi:two-component system sensor histidine kinase DegS